MGLLYELEKQVVKYNELEELFELQVSEHTQTTHSLTPATPAATDPPGPSW